MERPPSSEPSPRRPAAGTDPSAGTDLIGMLAGSAARSAADNLALVSRALRATTEEPGGADADREALDRAVVAALVDSPAADDLLEGLEPDALGALADRLAARLEDVGPNAPPDSRRVAWNLLDRLRRPALVRRIPAEGIDEWSGRFLRLIEASRLTVGPLFRQRAEAYGAKTLFELLQPSGLRTVTWRQAAGRVELLARGLWSLEPEEGPGPVAILSENRLELALVDLACLTSGVINVLIPANSVGGDVSYMLRHSRARTVILSTAKQLQKVLEYWQPDDERKVLPELRHVICIEPLADPVPGVHSLDSIGARASRVPASFPRERSEAVDCSDLASVMYTSGTTGTPKGIRFSHRNVVFKRFARGLAIPEIGEDDVFLCYLPLFHTFGRYLEMLGCVFWGATYCFLSNPSVEALVRGMRQHRPTVFISVPKKWIQLYERITEDADPMEADDEQLQEATRLVTGGRLRWGLSAAGHLDSDVFRFFQHVGIELMSGFGMTEGTGGITMTPPGRYKDDSLGGALPGIELRIEPDGELLVRGPYVMMGYLDPPDGETAIDEEGWFRTGDLMEVDDDGFLRLVDRKKEIYKNIKGETIAPQRVENLFRDFGAVQRVFLVGDHRPYNTVLLYPNPDFPDLDLASLSEEELREHLASIVVSVNRFLAPFERIVDFAVIDRDLDPEREELTAKGTPRRKVVERNFADTIRLLYRRASLRVGEAELTFPNWLFQALGVTAHALRVRGERLTLPSVSRDLTACRTGDDRVRIGSCIYRHERGSLDLGKIVASPQQWLGNEELVEFLGLDLPALTRPGRVEDGPEWLGRHAPHELTDGDREALEKAAAPGFDVRLMDLHRAALALASADTDDALLGVDLLGRVLADKEGALTAPARQLLRRTTMGSPIEVRRRAFHTLAPAEREPRFAETLGHFLGAPGPLLDGGTRAVLVEQDLSEGKLGAFIAAAEQAASSESAEADGDQRAVSLFRLLAEYGAYHPGSYRRLRAFLTRMMLLAEREDVRAEASRAVEALTAGFRQWLGPTARIAVDEETGQEYRWDDVIEFEDDVPAADRELLLRALKTTSFLREGVFLFSGGASIRLSDIPPGGVWIRLLGSRHGKSVYRITAQARVKGSYDLAVNVNHSLPPETVREEIDWLIICGDAMDRDPLVEDFGGYWPEQGLWTEEFIPGDTLERVMRRFSRRAEDDHDLFRQIWPFLAWTTLSAYVDFWNRTGRRWEIANAGMVNVVVPTHDYHTGSRIVSLSDRRPHRGLRSMLTSMRDDVVVPAEARYPVLKGLVTWDVVFASLLEVVGEKPGLELLRTLDCDAGDAELSESLKRFVDNVERLGFRPMRLYFAGRRYRRWVGLSEEHTPTARARMLQELYETYGLVRLARAYPEARVRFFRDTVFRDAASGLAEGLDELIGRLRRRETRPDDLIDSIADLRSRLDLGEDDDYFLARLSFPYLRPEDAAGFVQSDRGGRGSEMVVRLEDQDGNMFRVRHAMSPKEVGRLHQLFLAAKLDVRFRPEHQYLVALNERNQIVGGIYYDVEEDGDSAHLEKIVVAEAYRKKGVADGLMNDFFNRLAAAGVERVTTGFFRPQYFYGYGFKIEKRYAGLVKALESN
jgi:long-subunit acyl-CoA synthetase (AMP-forming)/GNAT superfamily N-acetyltransferase